MAEESNISFILDKSELLMLVGESAELSISPSEKLKDATISWNSDKTSIATVDAGKVTAKGEGTAIITATIKIGGNSYTTKCVVEVVSFSLSETGILMELNEEAILSISPSEKLKGATISWNSDKTSIATVAAGKVTATGAGTATITATIKIDGKSYTTQCAVYVVTSSIALNCSNLQMLQGGEKQLTVTTNLSSCSTTWSSNKDIVKVGEDGNVSALKVGKATITAKVTDASNSKYSCTRKCTVQVFAITLSEKYLSMLKGESQELTVNIPNGWSTDATKSWSSNNDIVKVDENGKVTAIEAGEATVTATVTFDDKQYSADCKVVVHEDKVEKLKGDVKEKRNEFAEKNKYDNLSGYLLELSKLKENTYNNVDTIEFIKLWQGDEVATEKMVLTDVVFHKEAYLPACLEVVIKTENDLSYFNDIIISSLTYVNQHEAEIQEQVILTDYIIFEKKKKSGYVTLKAYSFDKFLTLKKESRAFTAKRLSDIIGTDNNGTGNAIIKTYSDNVIALKYLITNKRKNIFFDTTGLQHLKDKSGEYYLPYSVQYDESFYDFLIRICNRNGEFLYCKNNTLYVGLPDMSAKKIDSANVEDIEYTNNLDFADTAYSEVILPDDYLNELDGEGKITDHVIQKDKEYVKLGDFIPPGTTVIEYLKDIAEAPTISQAILGTTFKLPIHFGACAVARDNMNAQFGKYFSTDATKKMDKIYLLSGNGKLLKKDFYKDIFTDEEKVKQGQVIVKLLSAPGNETFDVGDIVKIGDDETSYVVYSVKGSAKVVDSPLNSKETKDSGDGEKIKYYKESYELLLLPSVSGKYYPLPKPEMRIRKANPQKAIVCNILDPLLRGRVRVIFDWQKKENEENQTPWLNITYPKASNEEGFMFIPNMNDDVLVDFEGGNIERPFVVGSYYGNEHSPAGPASMHTLGVTKSITSKNGHHISFEDTPGSARMGEVLPVWSLLQKFGVGVVVDEEAKVGNRLSGGFEISDYYGIYKISGSTHHRNLSISSPYGDVKIDAFTGISIEAPLGDVKICGKNVEIEARNNLTITSGTNIGKPYYGSRNGEGWKGVGASFAKGGLSYVVGLIPGALKTLGFDLSLYRHLFEVLLRPIGGTMVIKSYRFMTLEAGDGEAQIVQRDTKKDSKGDVGKAILKTLIRSAFDEEEMVSSHKAERLFNEVKKRLDVLKQLDDKIPQFCRSLKSIMNLIITNVNDQEWESVKKIITDEALTTFPTFNNTYLSTKESEFKKLRNEYMNIKNLVDNTGFDLGVDTTTYDHDTVSDNVKGKLTEVNNYIKDKNFSQEFNYGNNLALSPKDSRELLYAVYVYNYKHRIKFESNFSKFEDVNAVKASIDSTKTGWFEAAVSPLGKIVVEEIGLSGAIDDNVWGVKDKGRIYFSTQKDKVFVMDGDGTIKESSIHNFTDGAHLDRIRKYIELIGN